MSVIVYHHLPKFGWTDRGYEYPLFWGLVMLAIALRGGGPYSIDRRIGREHEEEDDGYVLVHGSPFGFRRRAAPRNCLN